MTYPYETAPPNVGVALWLLEWHAWNWSRLTTTCLPFVRREKLKAKTLALINHDRIVTEEVLDRGLAGADKEGPQP